MKSVLATISNLLLIVAVVYMAFSPAGPLGARWAGYLEQRHAASEFQAFADSLGVPPERAVIEFIDFQCPACRAMHGELAALRGETPEISLITVHTPIRALHPNAEMAARVAICAEHLGGFSATRDSLFATESWHSFESVSEFSSIIPIDPDELTECVGSEVVTQRLDADAALAARFGVRSTPSYASARGFVRGALRWPNFAQRLLPDDP